MKKETKSGSLKKKRPLNPLNLICWLIIPIAIIVTLVLDGCGLYCFNTERIIVLGAGVLVVLVPFFSEITVKNFSIKKNDK